MKFLVDAQLPPALAVWLAGLGHEGAHVVDLGLIAASDRTIADWAEQNDLVLVSKDQDFLTLRLPDRFALLWLRVGNASKRSLIAWLEPRWAVVEQMLAAGERVVELR